MARKLSRRSSRLQNTSLDEIGRYVGKSWMDARERFILSSRGANLSNDVLPPFTLLPLTLLSFDEDSELPLRGLSARDCSASSSESISYVDVSSGWTVASSLLLDDENEQVLEDVWCCDDNGSIILVVVLRLADDERNAALTEEEEPICCNADDDWVVATSAIRLVESDRGFIILRILCFDEVVVLANDNADIQVVEQW